MKQQTLAMAADHNVHFEKYRKPTRGDKFLATMDKLVPWASCMLKAANVHDERPLPDLLRGQDQDQDQDQEVYGDSSYASQ